MRPRDEAPAQASPDVGALDQADHDQLTGLWTRRRFEDEFDRRLADARPTDQRLALLCIDVDGYRDVIGRHGARAAEGLIRSIGLVLAERLRPNTTLARMGGDEFAAVIPRARPALVQSVADSLCVAVREQSHAVGSSRVHATVSIGGVFLDPRTTLHEALVAADTVLHQAKAAGSDRAIVHEPSQGA